MQLLSLCAICGAIVLWVLLYLYVLCECVKCIFLKGKGEAFIIMSNVWSWRELYAVKNLPAVALWLLQLDKAALVSSEEKANYSLEVIQTGTDQNTLAKFITMTKYLPDGNRMGSGFLITLDMRPWCIGSGHRGWGTATLCVLSHLVESDSLWPCGL